MRDANDEALLQALAPLAAIDPSDRIAAPPRRLPLSDGRECLVLWHADAAGADWTLTLIARPDDPADRESPLTRLALHLPTSEGEPSAAWEGEDADFRAWLGQHLPGIAQDLAAAQPTVRSTTIERAGLSNTRAQKLGELLPHLVLLGALAAFVYMFGVVHIH